MIKSELIDRVAEEHTYLTRADAERIVTCLFEEITAQLAQGGRVELRGFGAFSVREYAPRAARNPRTGAPVQLDRRYLPRFKAGSHLHQRMNEDD